MEEQEYQCDACGRGYPSMSALTAIFTEDGAPCGLFACHRRPDCRETAGFMATAQAKEDEVEKEIRGRLLKDREDREALAAAILPGGALADKFEKLREDVEKLNTAYPLDIPRDAEKIVAQLWDILAAMPDDTATTTAE